MASLKIQSDEHIQVTRGSARQGPTKTMHGSYEFSCQLKEDYK